MSKEKTTTGGIGFFSMVFMVFLILKLAEIGQVAEWSWWWVTSPLWIPIALAIVAILIMGIIAIIASALTK